MIKIATVIGARPQFIKAAMLSRQFIDVGIHEILIHTGQHFDRNMSEVFFQELELPRPDIYLDINNDTNVAQTARVMMLLEQHLREIKPDAILVFGDTNATLAGAMAGAQLCIPIIHVEAGLRSYDRRMPEEINRVVTDTLSAILFCPTDTAVSNLKREGITEGVYHVGDIMYDAVLYYTEAAKQRSRILEHLNIVDKSYVLATVHRNFNTDDPERLKSILQAFQDSEESIVMPLHPRTRKRISEYGLEEMLRSSNVLITEPLGYLDMLRLQSGAKVIVTDSGGLQKEAYFNRVPSVILRENTEWVELIDMGWGSLVRPESEAIVQAIRCAEAGKTDEKPFGNGSSRSQIAEQIMNYFSK